MRKILGGSDLNGVIIVTIGTYFSSFFSYLFQYFLGRLLSIEDYGLFNTFLAISYIISVPSYVITTSLVRYVADLSGKKDFSRLSTMYKKLELITIAFGFLLTLVMVIFRNPISDYLKVSSIYLTVIYALVIGFSYLIIVPFAYLQGFLRYRSYTLSNLAASFFRFFIPVVLLYLNFGLPGVFAGMIMASLLSYAVSRSLLNRNLQENTEVNLNSEYRKIFIYSFPVLFINLSLILLNNIDLVIVKRLFSATEAGYYAGTVTLGKILLFGASTISTVMFPRIAHDFSQKKSLAKPFGFFFILQLVVTFLGTAAFIILPGYLTNLFFGAKFSGAIQYLPNFAIFIAFYVLVNFLVLFMLAIEKTYISLILMPTVIIQFILLNKATSINQIISIDTLISAMLFVLLLVLNLKTFFEKPAPSEAIS